MGRGALVVALAGCLLVDSAVMLLGDLRLGCHDNGRPAVQSERTLSESYCIASQLRCIRGRSRCSLRLRGGAVGPVGFDSDEVDDLPGARKDDAKDEVQLPSAIETPGHGRRQSQAVVDSFRAEGLRLPQDFLVEKPKKAAVQKTADMKTSKTNVDLTSLFGLDVKQAVKRAKREDKVLLVFVPDDSDEASTATSSLWSDEVVRAAATCECVPLCVLPGTTEASWLFQAHGQPASLPALYTISSKGGGLDTVHGDLKPEAVLAFIDVSLARVNLGDLTSRTLTELRRSREASREKKDAEKSVTDDAVEELDGLFDRVFESEMARRARERREHRQSTSPKSADASSLLPDKDNPSVLRRRWTPMAEGGREEGRGGDVVHVPRDAATMESAVRGAANNSVVRVNRGEYAWRWDLEVCDARHFRMLYDADLGVYVSERYAMEKTMQQDCLPRMADVLREHEKRQEKQREEKEGLAREGEGEEKETEGGSAEKRGGGEEEGEEGAREQEEKTLLSVNFEGGEEALLQGRWWMKLGTSGRLTRIRSEHASDGAEPCAHTPPHSIRIPDNALTPWTEEEDGAWERGGGGDMVYLVGPFEEPDALVRTRRSLTPYMRLNLSMIANDENMWLGKDGRWNGEHRGGSWDGNRFKYARSKEAREEIEIDALGVGAVGDGVEEYFVCEFCTPRVRNVFNVQGGPWLFAECDLRGGRVTVLRASHAEARVEAVKSFIGGLNGFDAEAEAERHEGLIAGMWERTESGRGVKLWAGFDKDMRASYGVSGMANGSVVRLTDCVVEDCGYMDGAAAQFCRGASAVLERCLVQNNGRAIGVDDSSHVRASESRFVAHRSGALFAMANAKRAVLELRGNVFRGRLWVGMQRPGTVLDEGNEYGGLVRARGKAKA